jgi:ribosomal protein S18 acetylase RimI-like enzyme
MIIYRDSPDGIEPRQLAGFFVGWPNPPSPARHLDILQNSEVVVLAVDDATGTAVGFITAITDHVVTAYIPHLEVLPAYQGQGIGRSLVERMVARLSDFYAIDLVCDPDVEPFYELLGFRKVGGLCLRNYDRQSGVPAPQDGSSRRNP